MPKPISHITVIRLSAMGDVAMTVPVLRALAKQYPQVKITVVSREFFKPFFDEIANVEFFGADLRQRHKGLFGLYRLYSDLKQKDVDAVADLHNVLRSKIVRLFFGLSGAKVGHINKGRTQKKALTRAKNKVFEPLKPTFERYADVFRELGFEIDLSAPEFPETPQLPTEVLSVTGAKSGNWIGIAPFAKHEAKQYPQDLMREAIAGLAAQGNTRIFLFGAGPDEIAVLESFAQGHFNVAVVAGKLSLACELRLIANLDAMLSMDSGNAHLAAMYGIPTATLWGATHPYAGFAPFNQPESNALVSDRAKFPLLPTSVYGNKIVGGYEDAMRTILPADVVRKVQSLLP